MYEHDLGFGDACSFPSAFINCDRIVDEWQKDPNSVQFGASSEDPFALPSKRPFQLVFFLGACLNAVCNLLSVQPNRNRSFELRRQPPRKKKKCLTASGIRAGCRILHSLRRSTGEYSGR